MVLGVPFEPFGLEIELEVAATTTVGVVLSATATGTPCLVPVEDVRYPKKYEITW